MFALDTNIFVYAHNVSSPLHLKAKSFLEYAVLEVNDTGKKVVCMPLQVCGEFINVCTRQNIGTPLSLPDAIRRLRRYTDILEIPVIFPQETQL